MSKAWSHLPNAHHIDWVLASLKETPELWNAARAATRDAAKAAARDAARDAAFDADFDAARAATWSAARAATWSAARDAARTATWSAARDAARAAAWSATFDAAMSAAWDVISALVSYDDCDKFLSMSYERLKVWAVLSEDPRAMLLLPIVYVKEKLANLNLQPA